MLHVERSFDSSIRQLRTSICPRGLLRQSLISIHLMVSLTLVCKDVDFLLIVAAGFFSIINKSALALPNHNLHDRFFAERNLRRTHVLFQTKQCVSTLHSSGLLLNNDPSSPSQLFVEVHPTMWLSVAGSRTLSLAGLGIFGEQPALRDSYTIQGII